MEWFIAAAAIVALGVAAMAAAGGGGGMSREPVYDIYRQQLPDRPLTGEDIQQARFGITFRGYAMGQVDDLLERLGREIADRDARIAELTGATGTGAPAEPPAAGPSAQEPSAAEAQERGEQPVRP
jgi:DivIVA domain-containing protein